MTVTDQTQRIAQLNDAFRQTFIGGKVMLTQGINAMADEEKREILQAVQAFNNFTPDNDPWGEHDFGAFQHNRQKIFWKLDYYDTSMKYGSEDPADISQTTRVLTIMLSEEY